jgi:hypothetical protein
MYRIRTALEQQAGNPMLNTLYFDEGAGTAAQAASAVAAFWTACGDLMSTACGWQVENEVALVDEATGDITGYESVASPGSGSGTLSGQPLPFATQGFMNWRTGIIVAGRRLAGRTFIPAATENLNDAGVPNGDYIEVLATAAAALIDDADSALLVYSPTHHTGGLVSSGNVGRVWGVLRSRRT